MAEENIIKKAAASVGTLAVNAVATYGLLLLVIIALLVLISFAGQGLDVIKEALNYAVSLIP